MLVWRRRSFELGSTISKTFRALKNKKMLYLLLLGMSSGLPFALTLGTLQAWMKDVNIDLKTIGLFAFLRLPFGLKFLWAPLMDRFSFPFLDRRRGWAFVTQILLALAIFAMSALDPSTQIQELLIVTLLVNFFAASQDIVLDAYRREILNEDELGLGISVFVNGYIVGFRYISGALALILPSFISWNDVYALMGGLMVLMSFVTYAAPNASSEALAPKTIQESFIGPIREYFSRPEALTILAFIVLYKLGDAMASTMTYPFIEEVGFTRAEYVAVVKIWGPIATFVGGLVGGHFVLQMGIRKSLWVMGMFQALSTVFFAFLKVTGKNNLVLAGIVGFENLTAQMGTAAYAAYMSSVTNVKFTASQYALLSSLMAIPGIIFASRTGVLAENLGWIQFFVFCGLAAAPGLFLIGILDETGWKGLKNKIRLSLIGLTVGAGLYALYESLNDILVKFGVPSLGDFISQWGTSKL
jgi:PAT family beta-lactamase induction signal transducer AmpG